MGGADDGDAGEWAGVDGVHVGGAPDDDGAARGARGNQENHEKDKVECKISASVEYYFVAKKIPEWQRRDGTACAEFTMNKIREHTEKFAQPFVRAVIAREGEEDTAPGMVLVEVDGEGLCTDDYCFCAGEDGFHILGVKLTAATCGQGVFMKHGEWGQTTGGPPDMRCGVPAHTRNGHACVARADSLPSGYSVSGD